MKQTVKIALFSLLLCASSTTLLGQGANQIGSSGFVGVNNTNPQHHLQVHGTTNYTVTVPGGGVPGPAGSGSTTGGSVHNYGVTSRISLTNNQTGSGVNNGGILMQSQNDLYLWNRASGNLIFDGGNTAMRFAGGSIYVRQSDFSHASKAEFNLYSGNNNGMRVRVQGPNKYGLMSIANGNEAALVVSDVAMPVANDYNFKVTGSGDVYGRKFITTLQRPFPDYVFEKNYNLLPLTELRTFITENGKLPNMPSAQQVEENGADIGEMNRLLVEKVEELTLYILQLEERLSEVESSFD